MGRCKDNSTGCSAILSSLRDRVTEFDDPVFHFDRDNRNGCCSVALLHSTGNIQAKQVDVYNTFIVLSLLCLLTNWEI